MSSGKFVAYYRVSTQKQGASGLGLEAQRAAVANFLNKGAWTMVSEFQEIETGKGADALSKRPELRAALQACKKQGATLIIAKLDRLARNVHFVSGLLETGVDFVAADMPQANKVMIQMHSVMSEWERDQISARTKAALAAAKQRGMQLGRAGPRNLRRNIEQRRQAADKFAEGLSGVLRGLQAMGLTQRQMVEQLNASGLKTARGGTWSLVQLQRILCLLSTIAEVCSDSYIGEHVKGITTSVSLSRAELSTEPNSADRPPLCVLKSKISASPR